MIEMMRKLDSVGLNSGQWRFRGSTEINFRNSVNSENIKIAGGLSEVSIRLLRRICCQICTLCASQ